MTIKIEFAAAVDRLAAAGLPHNIVEIGVLAWMASRRDISLAEAVDALLRIHAGDGSGADVFGLRLDYHDDRVDVRWVDGAIEGVDDLALVADDPVVGVLCLGFALERRAWGTEMRYTTARTRSVMP